MTTAIGRRAGFRGSAVRCARAVVVALLVALAVLIHHDTTSMAMPSRAAMSAMPGMDHTSAAMTTTPTAASAGHGRAPRAADMAMDDDGGACSGPAMQHCSSGDVGTPQLLAPPSALPLAVQGSPVEGVLAGHSPPGISHRAPPDLSVLSRLLI
ncbi:MULTISPECIES: hypothetical protein [unclassified Streptomyces]|uniref:hypothetical protein n=1 Tax=unclassified Streptomyces TaxID=2593676 RepID=UPI0027403489|nr:MULTISPECIES: hypothetical protein [unclassified Streptomyces]